MSAIIADGWGSGTVKRSTRLFKDLMNFIAPMQAGRGIFMNKEPIMQLLHEGRRW